MARKKLFKLPINANPSGPIKTAINFEVNNPAIILIPSDIEFRLADLKSTLELI
jgi:hypothetical protein